MKSASSKIIPLVAHKGCAPKDGGNARFSEKSKTRLGIMARKELFMTPKQALAEARKRWGKTAMVDFRDKAPLQAEKDTMDKKDNRRHAYRCNVGKEYRLPGLGAGMLNMGYGDTWEDAFARHDREHP